MLDFVTLPYLTLSGGPGLSYGFLALNGLLGSLGAPGPAKFSAITLYSYSVPSFKSFDSKKRCVDNSLFIRCHLFDAESSLRSII